ncbi:MAG TPA: GTPase [Gammaproteobacteria bacterium]|nr:GTPase [Gammaproteobacteria bacterium]
MSMQRLHQHMDEYALWKRVLIREIMRYRTWLARNQLDTPELLKQLEHSIKSLRADHLTLAFIGEFSRGKTELINSLFFSNFNQRLLPSHVGRTTMCPTEIFFDTRQASSSIQLLPIETRSSEHTLSELKLQPKQWLKIELDHTDTDSMISAFAHITQSKSVPIEQAISLGFLPEALEKTEDPDHVLIPTWRHALINVDHPLLRQGLRIIDTPGLNALGSEPELTLSLLPQAQAIVFLLSADTGVTASDMAIWQQYVHLHTQTAQFAVLNKIDTLWDSLSPDTFIESSIQAITAQTAQQLGLQPEHIFPVSAKCALQAKIQNDPALLKRSRLDTLESFLCEHVVAQKEQLIERNVVQQLSLLLSTSLQLIHQRLLLAEAEKNQLTQHPHSNPEVLVELLEQAQLEHQTYHRRLLNLKTNQRLLHRQGEILCSCLDSEAFKQTILTAQKNLTSSWTTLGINQAITGFFATLESNFQVFESEAQMANKMVGAIYARHNTENPMVGVDAPLLRTQRYRRNLNQLHAKAEEFRSHLKTLLTEQHQLGQRFYSTLVQEAISQHERMRHDTLNWTNNALTPLTQQNLEQKQLLESHMLRLKSLTQSAHSNQQRNQKINAFISDLDTQQAQANDILRSIRRPAPQRRQAKVVHLTTALDATGQD